MHHSNFSWNTADLAVFKQHGYYRTVVHHAWKKTKFFDNRVLLLLNFLQWKARKLVDKTHMVDYRNINLIQWERGCVVDAFAQLSFMSETLKFLVHNRLVVHQELDLRSCVQFCVISKAKVVGAQYRKRAAIHTQWFRKEKTAPDRSRETERRIIAKGSGECKWVWS